jgi:hypothetical protein
VQLLDNPVVRFTFFRVHSRPIISDLRFSALLTNGFVPCREETFFFKLAFRVFKPSATSEFLCALCVEILILTFALSLLRVSVSPWWMFLVVALPRCENLRQRVLRRKELLYALPVFVDNHLRAHVPAARQRIQFYAGPVSKLFD